MNSFVKQSVIYGIGQLVVQLVGFLIYPILTNDNYFTVEQFGIWNILAPTMTILTVIYSGGLSTGFFKYFINSDSPQQRYSAFSRSIFIILALGVSVSILGIGLLPVITHKLFSQSISWKYIVLVMLTAFANSITAVCLAVYRAQEKARQFVLINSLRFFLMANLVFFAVMLRHGGLLGLLLAYAGSAVVVALVLYVTTVRSIEKTPVIPGLARKIARFSFPLIPTQLAGWVLSVSDKFVIGIVLGAATVGLYSAGYQIAMVTNAFFIGPFSLAWGPFMFREGTKPDGPQKIADLLLLYTMLGAMFVTPFILFGVDLIALLSNNPSYAESYRVIPPVVAGYLFFGYYLFYTTGFNLNNKTQYFPLITGSVGVLNIILNLLLLPRYGYMAAAWVTLISYFFLFIVMKWSTARIYPLPVKWLRVIGFWIVLFGVMLVAQVPFSSMHLLNLSIKLLLNLALWVIFITMGPVPLRELRHKIEEWKNRRNG